MALSCAVVWKERHSSKSRCTNSTSRQPYSSTSVGWRCHEDSVLLVCEIQCIAIPHKSFELSVSAHSFRLKMFILTMLEASSMIVHYKLKSAYQKTNALAIYRIAFLYQGCLWMPGTAPCVHPQIVVAAWRKYSVTSELWYEDGRLSDALRSNTGSVMWYRPVTSMPSDGIRNA